MDRSLICVAALICVSCVRNVPVAKNAEQPILPIASEIAVVMDVPEYYGPSQGSVISLEEGEPAPISGTLLDEQKAIGAAKLRIAYDEVYQIASLQQRATSLSVGILEKELQSADNAIKDRDRKIDELENSFWAKHKLVIGIISGTILGLAGSFTAGYIWSQIDRD